jgi:Kef-type K+ transport system membrane component KefB
VLAYRFGFASILGAFAAGLLVHLIEVSGREPNQQFMAKLEGIGFGFLIPIFFISTGVAFQLKELLSHPTALAEVPLFLVALLVVRGLPALLYKRVPSPRHTVAVGLLQATTLTFVTVATAIGRETGKLTPTVASALVAADCCPQPCFWPRRSRSSPMPPALHPSGPSAGRSSKGQGRTVSPGHWFFHRAVLAW